MKGFGWRSASNFRYKLIKKYKHRAEKFMLNSITAEEREAWAKVVSWFDSVLKNNREITKDESIGLRKIEEEEEPITSIGRK